MKTEVDHLLSTLAEECAEVIQRVTKAQRWGLYEVQPGQELNNARRIRQELNDVRAVVEMLYDGHGIDLFRDEEQIRAKREKVLQFMKHAREIGELE